MTGRLRRGGPGSARLRAILSAITFEAAAVRLHAHWAAAEALNFVPLPDVTARASACRERFA
eukprot:4571086-Prymnesium_polylepis.1